jgi:hypothetical protein
MGTWEHIKLGEEASTYVNSSLSSLLSHFVKKKYFHGNMGTYKIGGASSTQGPRVLLLGKDLSKYT